eukprot:scaffold4261_cov110-Isochrysis_galbana.AAC.9
MGKRDGPPVSLERISPGDGKTFPAPGDSLTVHYTGTLLKDGTAFDCSRAKGVPFSFTLGAGAVIRGWELGLASMSLGERAKLTVRASAGYGRKGFEDRQRASGSGVIPPDADLLFDVELLDINHRRGVATEARLAAYRGRLDAWAAGKLALFDADPVFAAKQEGKHGSRAGCADIHFSPNG